MGIIRDSFVMFKNWFEAIDALPEEYQLETYKALSKYGLTGDIPSDISPIAKAILISFSKGMENNIARYNASVENGKLGGRPSKKTQQPNGENENLAKPNLTQQNQNEPTHNLNDNVNDNDIVNDNENEIKLVKENKNIFESYDACACASIPEKTMEERKPYLNYYKDYFDFCFSDMWKKPGYEIIDTMIEARQQAMTEQGLKFKQKTYHMASLVEMFAKVDVDKFRKIVTQLKFNEEINNRPFYILGCLEFASSDKSYSMTKEEMEKFIKENGVE